MTCGPAASYPMPSACCARFASLNALASFPGLTFDIPGISGKDMDVSEVSLDPRPATEGSRRSPSFRGAYAAAGSVTTISVTCEQSTTSV